MKRYRVYDINYDTDGHKVKLPQELFFDVDDPDFDPSYDLADKISNETGWCVNSFQFEEVPNG